MEYQNIDAATFAQLRDRENHVVLDVRSPQELAEGEVPGHVMINFFDPAFRQEIEKLDKEKTYLVYCRSGNISGQACTIMADMGFQHLYNLNGGIGAWKRLMIA